MRKNLYLNLYMLAMLDVNGANMLVNGNGKRAGCDDMNHYQLF